jgi:hypothetical protein
MSFLGTTMAWTELHDTLPDHPKTKLLMAEIGCTKAHAVGLVCALWCFVLRYGKDGSISATYWRAFAADMGEKDPDGTLAALRNAQWVDRNSDDTVTCHDWDDYAGRLEDYRKANKERQRRHREKMRGSEAVTPANSDVTVTSALVTRQSHTTQPNPTVPTKPNQHQSVDVPAELRPYRTAVEDWLAYKHERGQTYKPRGLAGLFKMMAKMGDRLPAAVEHSIANNYAGLFDKVGGNGRAEAPIYEDRIE